ncbi:hypothetical protein MMC09_005008 [Bachmanniomyces sp. S44760]|nr:hypothetical protein [Bachmanniomyces sp. S44760]
MSSESYQKPPLASNSSQREALKAALQLGALTGISGLIFGGTAGIIRSSHPTLFALYSGLQWFLIGTSYSVNRSWILQTKYPEGAPPSEKTHVSGVAGGITGACIAAVTRGRRNIIPGAIVFSLFTGVGQSIYNKVDARHTDHVRSELDSTMQGKPFWQRFADWRWTPVKFLSDEDYEKMLRDKLLRLDADIAIVDEDLAKVKEDVSYARNVNDHGDSDRPSS